MLVLAPFQASGSVCRLQSKLLQKGYIWGIIGAIKGSCKYTQFSGTK